MRLNSLSTFFCILSRLMSLEEVGSLEFLPLFRVQRVSCEDALGRIMDDIADFYGDESKNRSAVVNKIANGTFCAALYSEDDQWYRAVITKTYSPQQVEVHYIGNRYDVLILV